MIIWIEVFHIQKILKASNMIFLSLKPNLQYTCILSVYLFNLFNFHLKYIDQAQLFHCESILLSMEYYLGFYD